MWYWCMDFGQRTRSGNPFSTELILGKRGHCESKHHLDKKSQELQQPRTTLSQFLDPKAPAEDPHHGAEPVSVVPVSKPKPGCMGLGWEVTESAKYWQDSYKTYLYFVSGAERASAKFTVEKEALWDK